MIPERVHAQMDDEFVVFLIGMRVNSLWRVHRWLPVALAMPRMLRELDRDPDSGLLGTRSLVGRRELLCVQYWRSFDDLREYARAPDGEHYPAWVEYNESHADGAVGIWHETYLVSPGDYETVYNNMPPHGLGEVATLVDAGGQRASASGRLGRTDGDDAPIAPDGAKRDR